MRFLLCIDDTDNIDSPGSGQLAEILASELQHFGLAAHCSDITRHQLYFHKDIAYTSHNSSMCFSATGDDNKLNDIITFSRHFLRERSAPGSDPGLCVAMDDKNLNRPALEEFGLQAKKIILTKEDAYHLARKTGIHLSENGGSGGGVIGALAGTGLRLNGSDGRFRGWVEAGESGTIICPQYLCEHLHIEGVMDKKGQLLPHDTPLVLAESKVKSILFHHCKVIPVAETGVSPGPAWSTLTKIEIKQF